MIHVILADETLEVVEGAVSAAVEGEQLICRNASGGVVKVFDHLEVLVRPAGEHQ